MSLSFLTYNKEIKVTALHERVDMESQKIGTNDDNDDSGGDDGNDDGVGAQS